MDTKTVTLDIPEKIMHELERIAAQRRISVSQLMTEALVEMVEHEGRYADAKRRQVTLLKQGLDLGTGGHPPSSRDNLHERG